MLRGPRLGDDGVGRATLAMAYGRTDKRVVSVVPGGFDEDATQMAVARFRDAALRAFGATRVLGGHEADKRHGARSGRKAARVAEFRGDGERGQVVDAAEAAQPLHTRTERFEIEQRAEILFTGASGNECRRDDLAGDVPSAERTL